MNFPQHLPTEDQPDKYTGRWNRVHIQLLFPDTTAGMWHLAIGDGSAGTYCTRMNPMHQVQLIGAVLYHQDGGYLVVPPSGLTVGKILSSQHPLCPMAYCGQVLYPCPDCLTMAAVQAEMVSQRAYPIQRLLEALEQIKTPPA